MKTLSNIILLLAAVGITIPAAHAQYTLPFTVNTSTLSCADSNGNPCGSFMFGSDDYDFYASTDGTCVDSTTPTPQMTYPSTGMAIVDNSYGLYAGVSTSMKYVMDGADANYGFQRVDALDAKVTATVYLDVANAEREIDCEGNLMVNTSGSL